VSDLLFLYECATREVAQLRTIADRLGLSVQAASHTFRGLARRGLAELKEGRYRPTVAGVDWLHSVLGTVRDDLTDRLGRLPIVRTTQAIAATRLPAGSRVVLSLRDGLLTARAGTSGASRGTVRAPARKGELVEVRDLEGIVPLPNGRLRVLSLSADRLHDPRLVRSLRALVSSPAGGLLAAQGLEAYHLLGRAVPGRPIVRFGIAAAVTEATRLGVDCTVVVVDREVPRLFDQFDRPEPPALEILAVDVEGDGTVARRRPG
jgi:putative transcriptional regulator